MGHRVMSHLWFLMFLCISIYHVDPILGTRIFKSLAFDCKCSEQNVRTIPATLVETEKINMSSKVAHAEALIHSEKSPQTIDVQLILWQIGKSTIYKG